MAIAYQDPATSADLDVGSAHDVAPAHRNPLVEPDDPTRTTQSAGPRASRAAIAQQLKGGGQDKDQGAAGPGSAAVRPVQPRQGPERPRMDKFLGWWVIVYPDQNDGHRPDGAQFWITHSDRIKFTRLSEQISINRTRLKIWDRGPDINSVGEQIVYGGFIEKIGKAIRRLMRTPAGRELVDSLANGPHDVVVIPHDQAYETDTTGADDVRTRQPGVGSEPTVRIDPYLSDESIEVRAKNSKLTSDPFYVIFAHELIHANHNVNGQRTDGKDLLWDTKEEKNTTDGSGISENKLRRENGLEERLGHGGRQGGKRLDEGHESGNAAGG